MFQPYNNLSLRPWNGGLDYKLAMMKHRHTSGFISLTRDRDTGHVFPDPITGGPRIDYTASDFDRAHTLEGVEALAKLCYVTGAVQIQAALPGLKPFVPNREGRSETTVSKDPEFTDPAFAEWLQQVRKIGNKPPTAVWVSAHQMGSCRMSATENKGVVDSKGRVWGKKNLLVADSSIFPSASGVNPMITVMALADWVSRCLDEELKSETA
jgi:choline dehydrogenase-like flavoprotein